MAEVSNTPWNEMHCYVLSPRSRGVRAKVGKDGRKGGACWRDGRTDGWLAGWVVMD